MQQQAEGALQRTWLLQRYLTGRQVPHTCMGGSGSGTSSAQHPCCEDNGTSCMCPGALLLRSATVSEP